MSARTHFDGDKLLPLGPLQQELLAAEVTMYELGQKIGMNESPLYRMRNGKGHTAKGKGYVIVSVTSSMASKVLAGLGKTVNEVYALEEIDG